MKLIQIPFSHNCIKVRKVLDWKGMSYTIEDISPVQRAPVRAASGQGLVPVLVDGDRAVCDSTAIVLYLEQRCPDPPLLPVSPAERAECLVLEDWADAAFMELARRLAYWHTLSTPGALEDLFFPASRGILRRVMGAVARRAVRRRFRLSERRHRRDLDDVRRAARLAVDRLSGRSFLVGEVMTLADITLAAMSAPLGAAGRRVLRENAVRELLKWGRGVLGDELVSYYLPEKTSLPGDRGPSRSRPAQRE